jgi:hypothetical protein
MHGNVFIRGQSEEGVHLVEVYRLALLSQFSSNSGADVISKRKADRQNASALQEITPGFYRIRHAYDFNP